jgi:hypothetical protein
MNAEADGVIIVPPPHRKSLWFARRSLRRRQGTSISTVTSSMTTVAPMYMTMPSPCTDAAEGPAGSSGRLRSITTGQQQDRAEGQ